MNKNRGIKHTLSILSKSILILFVTLILSGCGNAATDTKKEPETPDTSIDTGSDTNTPDTTGGLEDEKKPTDTGSKDEKGPEDANFNEEEDVVRDGSFMAYINGIDPQSQVITVDDIEWIPSSNPERLKEIGVNPDDVAEYHIYNPIEENITYNYSDTLKVELVDELQAVEKTLEDLVSELGNNKILCTVTIADSEIVQITEQYTP